MRFCSRLLLPSLAAGLLAVVACSSSTTGSAQPGADGGNGNGGDAGVCGGFGSSDAVCDSCFQASCCSYGTACKSNQDCSTLFDCLQSCGDPTCEQNCQNTYPNGVAGVNAFFDCVKTKCATQCSAPPPSDAGPTGDAGACGGYGSQDPTCNTCLDNSCCTQAAACGASAACNTLFSCINQCNGDQTCANTCASQNQAAVPTYNAFVDCMNMNCTNACNGGPDGGPIVDAAGGG